ncbi:hypothetical protein MNY66_11940 [Moellerella wisconsensis]|uniref:hypothetical protein n=1 Tax=Moellerella wisconsensis TaxID=158849 RepID=UPI001F4EFA55|nr:hypothetical protein [Moellerella wisconsensis]UNH41747.1 hypothetical protein MNY66_11940 [Moellerella wisconsensis]
MCIAQRLQDKGRQEGLQQGIAQGIAQGIEQERLRARQCQVELARNLLKSGINLELLIKNTGLTREELISLP